MTDWGGVDFCKTTELIARGSKILLEYLLQVASPLDPTKTHPHHETLSQTLNISHNPTNETLNTNP